MVETKARFIALVAGISRQKQKEDSFSRVSICRGYLQLPSTPKTLELAILWQRQPRQTDKTDHFTPAAHAHGVIMYARNPIPKHYIQVTIPVARRRWQITLTCQVSSLDNLILYNISYPLFFQLLVQMTS